MRITLELITSYDMLDKMHIIASLKRWILYDSKICLFVSGLHSTENVTRFHTDEYKSYGEENDISWNTVDVVSGLITDFVSIDSLIFLRRVSTRTLFLIVPLSSSFRGLMHFLSYQMDSIRSADTSP